MVPFFDILEAPIWVIRWPDQPDHDPIYLKMWDGASALRMVESAGFDITGAIVEELLSTTS